MEVQEGTGKKLGRFGTGRGTIGDYREGLGDPRVGQGRDGGPSEKFDTGVGALS